MSTTIQVEIIEFRKLQENVQTPGPKCRNCFYDIIWDKSTSEQKNGLGKNWPFEMTKSFQHSCPVDQHNNYITRQGYTKDNTTGKVIWIGGPSQQQPQQAGQTSLSQHPQQPATDGVTLTTVMAQIGGLTNSIEQLAAAYNTMVTKQNQDIATLKTIVDEYIRHNPLESSFLELTKLMISKLSIEELGPRTADQYKVGFESTQ